MTYLRDILRDDPRFGGLLIQLQDKSTGFGPRTNSGIPERARCNTPRSRLNVQRWIEYQMVVPSPKHAYGYQFQKDRTDAPIMAQLVHVLDFDESKSDKPRSLNQILETLPEPICAVPTRTPGNWQIWLALSEPTWARLGERFGSDPFFQASSLAWNPLYRSFHPNERGDFTWWHPELSLGAIPVHPPGMFVGTDDKPSQKPVKAPRTPREHDGRRHTFKQLRAILRDTKPGQRHDHLNLYLNNACALAHREFGRDLKYAEVAELAYEANQLMPTPKGSAEVEGLVRHHFNSPFYKLQEARAKKERPGRRLDHDVIAEVERLGGIKAYAEEYEVSKDTAKKRLRRARARIPRTHTRGGH